MISAEPSVRNADLIHMYKDFIYNTLFDYFQIMLMGGTILGPGTIFLMLVGAFVAVFHIDNWTSFYYNIIPIILFVFVCFTCKSNIQVSFNT